MTFDKFLMWFFGFLGLANMVEGAGEWFEWWGNPVEPHFSHGSAALVWMALAALYKRTSDIGHSIHSPAGRCE